MQKAIIDDISLNNHLEKLRCLIEIQQENIVKLNNKFNQITNYYKTNNTNKILESNNIEENNLNIIKKDTDKYINVISHTITKYRNTQLKVSTILDNIIEEE